MKPKRFLISSLVLAGLLPPRPAAAALPSDPTYEVPKNKATLFEVFKRDHVFDLAGHRSHSSHRSHRSHSSHSSHSSHRSSSSGGYAAPVYSPPVYTQPAPVYSNPIIVNPRSGSVGGSVPTTLPGNSQTFTNIVFKVQTALYAYGYYEGPLTGVVDAKTKQALSDMQGQWGIAITGTITPDTLDALSITAE